MNFVLTSAFAVIFRGEALTARKIAGSALCLLAVLLFYLGGRSRGALPPGHRPQRARLLRDGGA